ncbi:42042_t:CDS:2 [Gigaspora margarita]|uniref:42042_t:CDS:1 n=1 Tax=Gigaspora margarita TaxID=4874 RepID=A0ABN7W5F3_GIGMA|nr:42042_t:CDS:2 [Gigaspora margarita]
MSILFYYAQSEPACNSSSEEITINPITQAMNNYLKEAKKVQAEELSEFLVKPLQELRIKEGNMLWVW